MGRLGFLSSYWLKSSSCSEQLRAATQKMPRRLTVSVALGIITRADQPDIIASSGAVVYVAQQIVIDRVTLVTCLKQRSTRCHEISTRRQYMLMRWQRAVWSFLRQQLVERDEKILFNALTVLRHAQLRQFVDSNVLLVEVDAQHADSNARQSFNVLNSTCCWCKRAIRS